jgi:hypothetical protein
MKVALCFIINYQHFLHKESVWKEWIEYNKDIINVYFYYSDLLQIKSDWIMKHTIPPNYIYKTTYFNVIPAYLSIMNFAINHDSMNQWFCLLTESCCPIISPKKFRYLFYHFYNKSIINWKKSWWNIEFHKRANLHKLPEELRLANDPWFVLKRENVYQCINFVNKQQNLTQTITKGGLANESLFAIILYCYNTLNNVIPGITHMTDWSRQSNSTSPHIFKEGNEKDIKFINDSLKENPYVMFIRKVHPTFPNEILKNYIYKYNEEEDKKLVLKNPFLLKKLYNIFKQIIFYFFILYFFYFLYILYIFFMYNFYL